MIRAALPHMRRRGGGRILNISSFGGRVGVPHMLPYCAGKFALVGLSEGLHAELAKDGIVVTTATPGLMRTGSHRNVVVRGQHEREALWFALADATGLLSMDVERAADEILDACRQGRAEVTTGWQARAAEVLHTLLPEMSAAVSAAIATVVLPAPVAEGDADRARVSRDIDLGWAADLMPTAEAERLNQPVAPDETRH